jgi:hypothetical protein
MPDGLLLLAQIRIFHLDLVQAPPHLQCRHHELRVVWSDHPVSALGEVLNQQLADEETQGCRKRVPVIHSCGRPRQLEAHCSTQCVLQEQKPRSIPGIRIFDKGVTQPPLSRCVGPQQASLPNPFEEMTV